MSLLLYFYVIIRILNIIIGAILTFVVLRRYLDTQIRLLFLLLGFGLGIILVNINLLLPIYTNISMETVGYIHTILLILGFSVLNLFFSIFAGELSPIRFSFIAGTTSSVIAVVIAASMYNFEILGFVYHEGILQSFVWAGIPSVIFIITIIGTAIFSYFDLQKSQVNAINQEQQIQIQRMKLGLVYALIIGQIIVIPGYLLGLVHLLELSIWFAMTIGWIPTMFGFLIITFAYTGEKQIGFLLPQKIDGLLVIDKSGLPLFEYEFTKEALQREVSLISGAIIAVKSLMNEAFGVKGEIQRIVFQDRQVLLGIHPQFSAILITERPTSFLSQSLRAFSEEFGEQFKNNLDSFNGDTSTFRNARQLVEHSFGIHGYTSEQLSL